jgi:hypothetical protein
VPAIGTDRLGDSSRPSSLAGGQRPCDLFDWPVCSFGRYPDVDHEGIERVRPETLHPPIVRLAVEVGEYARAQGSGGRQGEVALVVLSLSTEIDTQGDNAP